MICFFFPVAWDSSAVTPITDMLNFGLSNLVLYIKDLERIFLVIIFSYKYIWN